MAAVVVWDAARVDMIREMLSSEGLTMGAIAMRFNTSRGAIQGAIERNNLEGLSQHRPKIARLKPPTPERKLHRFIASPPLPVTCQCDLEPEQSPRAVSWEDFQPGCMCHWPINAAPLLFCGRAKLKRSAYCRGHFTRSRAA
jgi:hypothetical protein